MMKTRNYIPFQFKYPTPKKMPPLRATSVNSNDNDNNNTNNNDNINKVGLGNDVVATGCEEEDPDVIIARPQVSFLDDDISNCSNNNNNKHYNSDNSNNDKKERQKKRNKSGSNKGFSKTTARIV